MPTKFRCTKCGYEFYPIKKDRTQPFSICPYCSAEGTVIVKKHIIDEIGLEIDKV